MRVSYCPACGKNVSLLVPTLLNRKRLNCSACRAEIHIVFPIVAGALATGLISGVAVFAVLSTIHASFWVKGFIHGVIVLILVTLLRIQFSTLELTLPSAPPLSALRRFHLSTALVVSIFAGLLLYANFGFGQSGIFGWPFDVFIDSSFSLGGLVGDVLIGLFILFGVVVFCEIGVWEFGRRSRVEKE